MFAVEAYSLAARPGAYVFGPRKFNVLQAMEGRGWIDFERDEGAWVGRLTKRGNLALTEGVDPEALWQEPWDGKWRMVIFDLPRHCAKERARLLQWLRGNRFGCLQGSLWVRPRALEGGLIECEELGVEGDQMVAVESVLLGGARPEVIVAKGWNYEEINRRYQEYLDRLSGWKKGRGVNRFREVIGGWNDAARWDPFLPMEIEPEGYLGRKAWNARRAYLSGR
jgi:phenylacetic acid degradation operon negative regulatory protein